jgi:hypothetical protein
MVRIRFASEGEVDASCARIANSPTEAAGISVPRAIFGCMSLELVTCAEWGNQNEELIFHDISIEEAADRASSLGRPAKRMTRSRSIERLEPLAMELAYTDDADQSPALDPAAPPVAAAAMTFLKA